MRWGRCKRVALVVVGLVVPVVPGSNAEAATVVDCNGQKTPLADPIYSPVYVDPAVPGTVRTGPTYQVCVYAGTSLGVFLTPSETTVTTTGSLTTVKVAGGVCAVPGLVLWGNECVRNPSFQVGAGAWNYSGPTYGGTYAGPSVMPCIDTTSAYGLRGTLDTTVGPACARTGPTAVTEFGSDGSTRLQVINGLCVTWAGRYWTCVVVDSYTAVLGESAREEACLKVDSGITCTGAFVVCSTPLYGRSTSSIGGDPLPVECDAVPIS